MGFSSRHARGTRRATRHVWALLFMVMLQGIVCSGLAYFADTALVIAEDGTEAPSRTVEQRFDFEGRSRSYWIHLPPQDQPNHPRPLVLIFHGGGGSAEGAMRMAQMDELADAEGFMVVYPNGTGPFAREALLTWNTWNCCGYALRNQVDDVGFIRTLIERLEATYPIDPKRIYAAGLSNGGMMVYRLACELSDKIAAIAPVAGALNVDHPNPTSPVSVLIVHGTADEHILYEGGPPRRAFDRTPRVDHSVAQAVAFWVAQDHCVPTPQRETHGHVIYERYTGGAGGTEVVLYTILGQGHAWPGGRSGLRFENVDEPTQEISATTLIWDFFAHHPKP